MTAFDNMAKMVKRQEAQSLQCIASVFPRDETHSQRLKRARQILIADIEEVLRRCLAMCKRDRELFRTRVMYYDSAVDSSARLPPERFAPAPWKKKVKVEEQQMRRQYFMCGGGWDKVTADEDSCSSATEAGVEAPEDVEDAAAQVDDDFECSSDDNDNVADIGRARPHTELEAACAPCKSSWEDVCSDWPGVTKTCCAKVPKS